VWVSRHPLNNSLAVFIHGLWGSRWVTWRHHVDFFQHLPNRPELRSYDVYLFTYDSPWFGAQPSLHEQVAPQLRAFLERERSRYDTIVFVCHSQGGLVGKLYLIDERRAGRSAGVDLILTLNTPHRGANWRNPLVLLGLVAGACLNALPVVRRLSLLRQLADLGPWSPMLRYVRDNWDTCAAAVDHGAAADERLRSVAVCGISDWFVSSASAEGFYADEKDATGRGHRVDSREVADYVGYQLAGHAPPTRLRRELSYIGASADRLAAFEAACTEHAARELDLRGIGDDGYARRRAPCFVHEFRRALSRHPLRKLSSSDAFARYVGKVLDD
jgi:hypothetical protein